MAFATASGGPAAMVAFDLARSFTPTHAIGPGQRPGQRRRLHRLAAHHGPDRRRARPASTRRGMDAYTLGDFRLALSVQYLFWALGDRADPALPPARARPPRARAPGLDRADAGRRAVRPPRDRDRGRLSAGRLRARRTSGRGWRHTTYVGPKVAGTRRRMTPRRWRVGGVACRHDGGSGRRCRQGGTASAAGPQSIATCDVGTAVVVGVQVARSGPPRSASSRNVAADRVRPATTPSASRRRVALEHDQGGVVERLGGRGRRVGVGLHPRGDPRPQGRAVADDQRGVVAGVDDACVRRRRSGRGTPRRSRRRASGGSRSPSSHVATVPM